MFKDINGLAYCIVFFCIIMANFFSFDVINQSMEYFEEARTEYAETLEGMIKELSSIEKENAIDMSECFNTNIKYTKNEILNNKKLISDRLDEYNFLLASSADTYVIFEDGEYIRTSGNTSNYFEKHSVLNDSLFGNYFTDCGFNVVSYINLDDEEIYAYEAPLLDANNEIYAIMLRTVNIEEIASNLLLQCDETLNFTITVTDLDSNAILVLNEDGKKTKKNDSQLSFYAKDYIENAMIKYNDDERKITYYIYIDELNQYKEYKRITFAITFISLILVNLIVIVFVLKRYNIKRDARIAALIMLFSICGFVLSFDTTYRSCQAKMYYKQVNVCKAINEKKYEMQDIAFNEIGSSIYVYIANDENVTLEKVKDEFNKDICTDIIKYLNTKDVYLLNENRALDLYNNQIIPMDEKLISYYNKAKEKEEEYLSFYDDLTSYANSNDVKIYNYKNKRYALCLINKGNDIKHEYIDLIEKFVKSRGHYSIEMRNDSLYIAKIRADEFDRKYEFDVNNYIKIKNDELKNDVLKLIASDDEYIKERCFDYNNFYSEALLVKSIDENGAELLFFNEDNVFIIRRKTFKDVIGLAVIFILMIIADRIYTSYKKNQKETIQLHGNY